MGEFGGVLGVLIVELLAVLDLLEEKRAKSPRLTGVVSSFFVSSSFSTTVKGTVFENHRKSRIQLCERSELRLHVEWTKVH